MVQVMPSELLHVAKKFAHVSRLGAVFEGAVLPAVHVAISARFTLARIDV